LRFAVRRLSLDTVRRKIKTTNTTNMSRLLCAILAGCCSVLPSFAAEAQTDPKVPGPFDRPAVREPRYQSTPKYSLMALGRSGDVKVWMVEDGRRLFVDKNANGDLTDDGPPVEPSNVRNRGTNQWDFNYVFDAITPANGSRHTNFDLRRWNYGEGEEYGLSLTVDGQLPLYAGWFDTFWSTKRETAPVIHFGGPFKPKLLRSQEFTIQPEPQRVSVGFVCPGSEKGAVSRLSIEALPRSAAPKLHIEWPTASGNAPLKTTHALTARCCYWDFYDNAFEVPKGAVVGKAKVSVEFPKDNALIALTTTDFEVPVVVAGKSSGSTP
jgi:hypothetical protein